LDDYEPRLRAAIKDSNLARWSVATMYSVVIAPVDGSYNPKRPAMLLPVTLGPFTRVAKAVEADPKPLCWCWATWMPPVPRLPARR